MKILFVFLVGFENGKFKLVSFSVSVNFRLLAISCDFMYSISNPFIFHSTVVHLFTPKDTHLLFVHVLAEKQRKNFRNKKKTINM